MPVGAAGSAGEALEGRAGLVDDAIDQLGHGGQIVDDADALAGGQDADLGRPSTMLALISIGALAAIASWLQVMSWFRFMARPSRAGLATTCP